jgi:hypothetical protein
LTTNRAGKSRKAGQQAKARRAGSSGQQGKGGGPQGKARQPGSSGQQGRPARSRNSRPPRPLPPGDTLLTPGASPARQVIERRSAAPLLMLRQLPVWVAPVILVALLVTGLAVRTWPGAVALCGVAGVLGWLAALSWPRLNGQGRVLRIAVIAAVLVAAALHFLHRSH